MTIRYTGMNRTTGRALTDDEHISQSMSDILRTPIGSRVMRRDYGSLLSALIDQPQSDALKLQIMAACYMALLKWEPRVSLTGLTVERDASGNMTAEITGQRQDTGAGFSSIIPLS
ncbi:GPW/gp25 family protein [Entomohabitans teleogrylli]|uniref:GPW/gp25 family protein n=1 Tax=Entomohabitans teleogrylli TaxID=1384589 RepID=UPI00073D83C0|nr:GPW/gp25 family protein [Entomohabitans teleogrylli]